jgi:xanthine dehydrogenase molybdopterin-binding subunit B
LLLGVSVWTAVKHALSFVAHGQRVRLNLPATGEEVLARLEELGQKTAQKESINVGVA